jgi:hypothetical protein
MIAAAEKGGPSEETVIQQVPASTVIELPSASHESETVIQHPVTTSTESETVVLQPVTVSQERQVTPNPFQPLDPLLLLPLLFQGPFSPNADFRRPFSDTESSYDPGRSEPCILPQARPKRKCNPLSF